MRIEALAKPAGSWCGNCKPGAGCTIYPDRPQECRDFICGYLMNAELGDEWKPNHCKIVLVSEHDGNRIVAQVDPQRPDAWRRDPYYRHLKKWAARSLPFRGQVIAAVGRRMYMIFPDRDVDLGVFGLDEFIVVEEVQTPVGVRLEARKVDKNDPRARAFAAPNAAVPASAETRSRTPSALGSAGKTLLELVAGWIATMAEMAAWLPLEVLG
jgi:hypothetical protein